MSETTGSSLSQALPLALILVIGCASIGRCYRESCELEQDYGDDDFSSLELHSNCGSHSGGGHKLRRRNRVAGGYNARPGEFPSYVRLSILVEGRYRTCGGVLISDRALLTAAHCLVYEVPITNLTVFAGSVERNSQRPHSVQSICVPKEYPPLGEELVDAAVLFLEKPVVFDDDVQPVCLPDKEMPTELQAFVVGLGYTSLSPVPQSPEVLQVLPVRKLECSSPRTYRVCFNATGTSYRGDSCQGDSGGPVYVEIDNKQTLVGLVTGGLILCEAGLSVSGWYADVYPLRNIINRLLKDCN